MRLTEVIVGTTLLVLSILGYLNSGAVVNDVQKVMMDSMSPFLPPNITNHQSPYLTLAHSDVQTMTKIVQYGFGSLALSGLGFTAFGILAKKKKPKEFTGIFKVQEQNTPRSEEDEIVRDNRGLKILKERLARGEITEKEFETLKRFFE